jgi:hypothetical protein
MCGIVGYSSRREAAVTGNVLLVLRVGTTDREVAEAKLEVLLLPGGVWLQGPR